MNKLWELFNPTLIDQLKDMKKMKDLHDKAAVEKGCATCRNKELIGEYNPSWYDCEKYRCTMGLECDTMLSSVKDCPMWEDGFEYTIFSGGEESTIKAAHFELAQEITSENNSNETEREQLTDNIWDWIISSIVNRSAELPKEEMNVQELTAWMNGYAKCQLDIIDLLNVMRAMRGG